METVNNLLNIQIAGRVAASTSMILIGFYLFLVVEVVANHMARFASHNTSQTHVTYCL